MNHVAVCIARDLSDRAAAAALVGLMLCALAAGPVAAQSEAGARDLPNAGPVDAASDPSPVDPRLAIRRYIRDTLPSRWWANEAESSLGTFSVMIHIPEDWRGNPTSAMLNLCPPAYSMVWRNIRSLELVPFYRQARWAGAICRK